MNDLPLPLQRVGDPVRFRQALALFDEANAADPNREWADECSQPRELLYSKRLTTWVIRLCPDPSEPLLLAARCQHLQRWVIPRESYEKNRTGYLRWRNDLKQFHAERAGELLRAAGYGEELITRVQALNRKAHFPHDPESQTLEDALCLVFLQHQLADLARKTPEDRTINALQKSWRKMSPLARQEALGLELGDEEKRLIDKALQGTRT